MTDQVPEAVVAIDVGGSKIASAVVTRGGVVFNYRVQGIDKRGGLHSMSQLINIIRLHIEELGERDLIGVGVSIPGIVKGDGSVWAPNIRGWRWVNLASFIRGRLGIGNVTLVDDRVANIVGEQWMGEAKGARNAVSLILGTGVAAGLLVDGKPVSGASGVSGAVGWWLLGRNTPRRRSARGFLESEVSGPALFKRTRRYCLRIRDEGCLRALSQCSPGDAECVFKAFDNGVSAIGVVLRREASIIGVVVANIISILNPEVVVLGGGLGVEVGRRFMDVVITTASKVAQPYSLRECRITVSKLGYLSNIYGAAKLVIDTHGS